MLRKIFINNFKVISLTSVFLLAYFPTLIWMWDRWFVRDSYYSHGILIPFVVGYLIWQKKDALRKIKKQESPAGLYLIALGLLIHVISSILRIYFTSGFSMLIVLIGSILYLYGKKTLREIAFPIGFIIFMIPLPMIAITNISFKLKIMAAQLATVILNHIGIPALREGSLIKMQSAYVVVEDVCSGLRSLIALMALGSIVSYWFKSTWPRRLILFLSTIPIAIITNAFRVVLLAFISEIWGTAYAQGFVHDLSGLLVFACALILLLSIEKLLK